MLSLSDEVIKQRASATESAADDPKPDPSGILEVILAFFNKTFNSVDSVVLSSIGS